MLTSRFTEYPEGPIPPPSGQNGRSSRCVHTPHLLHSSPRHLLLTPPQKKTRARRFLPYLCPRNATRMPHPVGFLMCVCSSERCFVAKPPFVSLTLPPPPPRGVSRIFRRGVVGDTMPNGVDRLLRVPLVRSQLLSSYDATSERVRTVLRVRPTVHSIHAAYCCSSSNGTCQRCQSFHLVLSV